MPREYEVNGVIYEFDDDVGEEQAAQILKNQGVDMSDPGYVRAGAASEGTGRNPGGTVNIGQALSEGGREIGKGALRGVENLGHLTRTIAGAEELPKNELLEPDPSVPGSEGFHTVGKLLPGAAAGFASGGPVLVGATAGAIGGAAESGTPTGAATGAVVGGGLGLGAKLAKILFQLRGGGAQAIVDKAADMFPGVANKITKGRELGAAVMNPARAAQEARNLEAGMRNTIEAGEEQSARSILQMAEQGPQRARGAAMAAEERAHVRGLAENNKVDRLAGQSEKEAAARAQRRQGANMAKDDKAQFEAIVEDRTRERAARDVIEKARGAGIERQAKKKLEHEQAIGEAQFREETAHRNAIVENNARERAADAAEGGAEGAVSITKPRAAAPSGETLTKAKPETIDISDGGFIGGVNPKTRTFGLRGPSGERIGGKILDDKIEIHSVGKGSAADSRSAVEAARKLGERTGQPVFIVASEQSESGGKFIQRLLERGELEKVEGGWKLVSRKAANEKVFKAKVDASRATGEVLGGTSADDLERQLKASLEINKLKGKK